MPSDWLTSDASKSSESGATRLTNRQEEDGPDSLPIAIIQRCMRVDDIRCLSHNLSSLEGCPDGLKVLGIGHAYHLADLSPLASGSRMQHLEINYSSITDVSVVSSMPLLEVFICQKEQGRPSIKDFSPFSSCTRLEQLWLGGNREIKDLYPLSACTTLEELEISDCPLITSLVPLSNLKCLNELWCCDIDPQNSLLPLVSCIGLKWLHCNQDAVDLEELMRRRPNMIVSP